MRISDIEVTNYRSFENSDVISFPDIPYPISIIGHNNSGKTNLIMSILQVTGVRSSYPTTFSENDFYGKNQELVIEVEANISPPLISTNAFNIIKEMPKLKLVVGDSGGGLEVQHHCCDSEGKKVFNPRSLKRPKTKTYTEEEKEALNKYQKSGAEQVHKWKSQIPVYYLGPDTLEKELKGSRYTLLGKLVESFKEEFGSPESVMKDEPGVISSHIGKLKSEVYNQAIQYLESHVLPTAGFELFLNTVERVLKEQLEISSDDFKLLLSPPDPGYFYDQLEFQVRETSTSPRLPVLRNGMGFISLFVTALLRALVESDSGGNVFILEEPESFLHEHYQEYFYRVLCDLASNNQVILTTHSKKFVNIFEPRSIIRIERNAGSGSRPISTDLENLDVPDVIDGLSLTNPKDYPKYLRTLEPNLGNIAFSKRVIIVEGPHDILAYRTVLECGVNLELNNTSIVAAWGKDPIITIVQFCNEFEIPVFVIHDSDLEHDIEGELSPSQKAQVTKNEKIKKIVKDELIHKNVPNLEAVLGIPLAEKGAVSVMTKLTSKTVDQVRKEFPDFLPNKLLDFVGCEYAV